MPGMLFRAAKASDLEAIHQLALNSGSGITTLSKSKDHLQMRLSISVNAFAQSIQYPHQEYYLFVLEALDRNTVVGTSAIEASIGRETPFFTYNVTQQTRCCKTLGIHQQDTLLNPLHYVQRKSEVCTLYLDPQYRKSRNGALLSRARFLFMAQFPERFESSVIAELRGKADEQGNSPFWEGLGKYLYPMSFSEADELSLVNKEFLGEFLPDYPINTKLLSAEAQAVIGEPHDSAQGARHILFSEGFAPNGWIDVFDAGPTLEAPLNQIKTVCSSQCGRVKQVSNTVPQDKLYLIATTTLDFRAVVESMAIDDINNIITINQATATALQVQIGDYLRFVPLI